MRLVIVTILSVLFSLSSLAQEIDFGDYSALYSISLTELSPGMNLNFGTVADNEGLVSIDINDAKIYAIEGVKYLDIIVDITADQFLLLDGNLSYASDPTRRIELTMAAAYANMGIQDPSQAIIFNVFGTTASAQFPIKYRGNTLLAHHQLLFIKAMTLLFSMKQRIYIYASINLPGGIVAGSYTGNINVSISYD